ncbi:uncharacterized protein LOC127749607 [Frankliniella occidentalis]|uniref:Uncharacterized protein LOC127749607 n=1 Tax=Frankliniella occidentalis TaxID=133901 RepID=A0A9C6U7D8_FRAOC|nr:uncharacterized protein LOC127749607 [Frankliniella occidentalis]
MNLGVAGGQFKSKISVMKKQYKAVKDHNNTSGGKEGDELEVPASPVTPRAALSSSAGAASLPAGGSAAPRKPREGTVASTPVSGIGVFNCEASSSVSPICGTGWRPQLEPRTQLPDFALKRHEANLAAGGLVKYKPLPQTDGRRLITITYDEFVAQINADKHVGGYCSFLDYECVGETRLGFRSLIYHQCQVCSLVTKFQTDAGPTVDVNTSMVLGTVEAGIRYEAVRTLAGALNMPAPTKKTYGRYEDMLADVIKEESMTAMLEAGKREYDHAVAVGNVSADGTPFVTG